MEDVTKLDPPASTTYAPLQLSVLVVLRILIGWHFLYEGLVKLFNPYWSAAGFLSESQWLFSGLFHWLAESPAMLSITDVVNSWGLVIIGVGLMLGLATRTASIAGAVLLFLYWLCNPPLIGLTYSMPTEGSYLIVNKNLIEAAALCALAVFPTGTQVGLDALLRRRRRGSAS